MYHAKHQADSEAHFAISSWYAGTALVELLDVDRLFSRVPDQEKGEDLRLLVQSAGHLRTAAEHWEQAERACATVASVLGDTAESRLLKEDIKAFGILARGARDLATQMDKGILPPNTPVHRLTAIMREQDSMAERRSKAYQGLPGHLPAGYI